MIIKHQPLTDKDDISQFTRKWKRASRIKEKSSADRKENVAPKNAMKDRDGRHSRSHTE